MFISFYNNIIAVIVRSNLVKILTNYILSSVSCGLYLKAINSCEIFLACSSTPNVTLMTSWWLVCSAYMIKKGIKHQACSTLIIISGRNYWPWALLDHITTHAKWVATLSGYDLRGFSTLLVLSLLLPLN